MEPGQSRSRKMAEAAGAVVLELIRSGRADQAAKAARLAARIGRRALVRERLRRLRALKADRRAALPE